MGVLSLQREGGSRVSCAPTHFMTLPFYCSLSLFAPSLAYPPITVSIAIVTTNIHSSVSMVGELLQFPRIKSKDLEGLTPAALVGGSGSWPNDCESKSSCKGLVTPGVIKKRYSLPSSSDANATRVGLAYGAKANGMAVAEFQGQYYKESDLTAFGTACHVDVKVDKTIGGNGGTAGIEAELDIEYIKAVAPEVPLTVIYASECECS